MPTKKASKPAASKSKAAPKKSTASSRKPAAAKASATRKAAPAKRATPAKKATTSARRPAAKRELIDTGTDKRFVRRGAAGKFKESDDVGRSLAQDVRKHAKTVAPSGQGDRGDHAVAGGKKKSKK